MREFAISEWTRAQRSLASAKMLMDCDPDSSGFPRRHASASGGVQNECDPFFAEEPVCSTFSISFNLTKGRSNEYREKS